MVVSFESDGNVIRVRTPEEDYRPVTGADTTCFPMPQEFYVKIGDNPPALAAIQFARFLRGVAEEQAAGLGERLHHAEFVVTTDPAVIETRVVIHDCQTCRDGAKRISAHLREHPGTEMVVGTLYWG